MQSFYRRFVRDFMRYRDEIQCAGAELVRAVREDALATNPGDGGDFYALHLRRGDFQFKVKIHIIGDFESKFILLLLLLSGVSCCLICSIQLCLMCC